MIIFRKARRSERTLNDLDEYLRRVGTEPAKWLAREVRSWGEFSYDDLAAAIEDGRLDDLIDWQARYADIINGQMAPLWAAAFVAAAEKATRGKIIFFDSDVEVRNWLETRCGELITQISEESRRAIANVILRAQAELMNPKKIAQQIRPLIGLNAKQAEANYKYRQKIYQRYLDRGVREEVASRQAEKAALKYAAKQHRFRAETIAHTELAFAYNRGAHAGVMRAISQNLMGRCAMVWTTAGTNRVCSRCLALKDSVVGYTDESGVTLPPLHPRCRCAISYREVGDKPQTNKPRENTGNETPTTSGTRTCKPLTPEQIKEIRDAEEKAYNAKMGADFGFKKMNVTPAWDREILLTNPPDKIYGHTPNCQRCVVAHEARMRGYDVIARPSWGDDDTLRNSGQWLSAFDYNRDAFKVCTGKTGEEVIKSAEEIMRSFGEGARAIVVFKWDKINGHVIAAQCQNHGIVNFGDPQWGERFAAYKLKSADIEGGIVLLRVDNLKFTDVVKRCCKNRE